MVDKDAAAAFIAIGLMIAGLGVVSFSEAEAWWEAAIMAGMVVIGVGTAVMALLDLRGERNE